MSSSHFPSSLNQAGGCPIGKGSPLTSDTQWHPLIVSVEFRYIKWLFLSGLSAMGHNLKSFQLSLHLCGDAQLLGPAACLCQIPASLMTLSYTGLLASLSDDEAYFPSWQPQASENKISKIIVPSLTWRKNHHCVVVLGLVWPSSILKESWPGKGPGHWCCFWTVILLGHGCRMLKVFSHWWLA